MARKALDAKQRTIPNKEKLISPIDAMAQPITTPTVGASNRLSKLMPRSTTMPTVQRQLVDATIITNATEQRLSATLFAAIEIDEATAIGEIIRKNSLVEGTTISCEPR